MQVDIEIVDDFLNAHNDETIGPPNVEDEAEKRLQERPPRPTLFLAQIDDTATTIPSSLRHKTWFGFALGQGRAFKEHILN